MRETESRIAELLRACIPGARPRGLIQCESEEGVAGYSGRVETGWFKRETHDIDSLLRQAPAGSPDFADLLFELREVSRSQPLGPWYRCNIELQPGRPIAFNYFWENAPFASLKDLAPDPRGRAPNFALARRFDPAWIAELTDFDVNASLLFYVPARVKAGQPVSDPLLEVFATLEWESDVNNGAMNQYFARDHEPMTGLPRSQLYDKTHRGLLRLGQHDMAALYAEAIALYAHFYPRVEQARAAMGIAPVPKQEQSDIMDRYYERAEALEPARVAYIRAHIAELEQAG